MKENYSFLTYAELSEKLTSDTHTSRGKKC